MKKETIPAKDGKKAIHFNKGGLHESTHTPAGEKIPAKKMAAAEAGKDGPKAKKQADFAKNVLEKHHSNKRSTSDGYMTRKK